MRVFVGMETSGQLRRRFKAAGHEVISADFLACQDQAEPFQLAHEAVFAGYGHVCGDVFETLDKLRNLGWWPDLAVFHPTCTYLTVSAAWAFKDPDYVRYPGVGYHQKLKPGTLFGKARREARDAQVEHVKQLWALPIKKMVIENPIGSLSTMWQKPNDVVQPYEFGDDASKATCLLVARSS